MAVKRRQFNAFSLSFLDIMSCGFGAVVLLFMIINHGTQSHTQEVNKTRMAEVRKLQEQVLEGKRDLVMIRNALTQTENDLDISAGESQKVIESIAEVELAMSDLDKTTLAKIESVEKLKSDLQVQEDEAARLRGSVEAFDNEGEALRSFQGDGNRQYLTGLRMAGDHILVLLDASASMLDETIVNVIRRRNLPDYQKLQAPKWRRAVSTVDWLATQIPRTSKFQMYTFNTEAKPLLRGTDGEWLETERGKHLNAAIDNLNKVIPAGGTSLHAAWDAILEMDPMPDNIFLIVDGLPTQDRDIRKGGSVSAKERARIFESALGDLPGRIPVNIILLPMEGDPQASSAYWRMAIITGGSYMAPSKDWP